MASFSINEGGGEKVGYQGNIKLVEASALRASLFDKKYKYKLKI